MYYFLFIYVINLVHIYTFSRTYMYRYRLSHLGQAAHVVDAIDFV